MLVSVRNLLDLYIGYGRTDTSMCPYSFVLVAILTHSQYIFRGVI